MVQEQSQVLSAMNGITENGSNLLQQSRTTNVLWKRKEQLLRWEDSETNKTSVLPKEHKGTVKRKVKFPEGCVFLAACASGDEEEVESLIEKGTDINTSNVDGLTALHQAVIDENLDMVQFLIDQGVDINAQDNEGWSALHAAVSCGFEDIVRCLLDHLASLGVVNNDGELAIDLAESEEMKSILRQEINKQNLDLDRARMHEEEIMLKDATDWLHSRMIKEKRHPKTGATALHVAASKGYLKVINILVQAGADVNAKDKDGWTPLHAAAHWAEREACQVLAENGAKFDILNLAEQSPLDVADEDVVEFLKELKDRKRPETPVIPRDVPVPIQRRKNSVTRVSTEDKHVKITKRDEMKEGLVLKSASESETSDAEESDRKRPAAEPAAPHIQEEMGQGDGEPHAGPSEEPPAPVSPAQDRRKPKIPKLDVPFSAMTAKVESPVIKSPKEVLGLQPVGDSSTPNGRVSVRGKEVGAQVSPVSVSSSDSSIPTAATRITRDLPKAPPYQPKPLSPLAGTPTTSDHQPPTPSWRLTGRKATNNTPPQSPTVPGLQKSGSQPTQIAPTPINSETQQTEAVKWRQRPFSATDATIGAGTPSPQHQDQTPGKLGPLMFPWEKSAFPPEVRGLVSHQGKTGVQPSPPILHVAGANGTSPRRATGAPSILATIKEKVSTVKLRSFTPPARKESAETERKAYSRKQRETRRSTQGITLEQIQSAHEIYDGKEKDADSVNKETQKSAAVEKEKSNGQPQTPATPSSPSVPPWRSRALENASQTKPEPAPVAQSGELPLKPLQQNQTSTQSGLTGLSRARPATVISHVDTTGSAKEEDGKGNGRVPSTPSSTEQSPVKGETAPLPPGYNKTLTTPSATALRRRPRHNRRSTGPVAQEDIENLEKEEGADEAVESGAASLPPIPTTGKPVETRVATSTARLSASLSGYGNKYPSSGVSSDRASSRTSSVASLQSSSSVEPDIDYKKLYTKEREENEKLRQRIKDLEKQMDAHPVPKVNPVGRESSGPLTDRDRRAYERKISELEEEVKTIEGLRADNQRLKDENGALIRVISKLSK